MLLVVRKMYTRWDERFPLVSMVIAVESIGTTNVLATAMPFAAKTTLLRKPMIAC